MDTGEKTRIFHGGDIWTADPRQYRVEAVAVRGSVILATGSLSSCESAAGRGSELVSLEGSALVPGFCDAHMHPLPTIFSDMSCNLSGVRSMDELVSRLGENACGAGRGEWVVGLHFDEQNMEAPQLPTRHDLDRVAGGERPVVVIRHDGHSLIASTRAMELAGVTAATPTPRGGSMERDGHGMPLGIFRENAEPLILGAMALPDAESFTAGARKTFERMLGHGITSLGVMLGSDPRGPSSFDVPAMELLKPVIRQSVYAFVIARDVAAVGNAQTVLCKNKDPRFRVAGIKIIADGTFGSRTAAMEEPFSDEPAKAGFLLGSEDEIRGLMAGAHTGGWQIAVHAIGDRAIRTCLGIYADILAAHPRKDHRHRIEHASIMDADMLRAARELGLVLCVQPLFIFSDMPYLEKRLGLERMGRTYPFRSMLEQGLVLAASSDSPVESQDVMGAVQCAVTRHGYVPEQAVTVEQALGMYTLGAAHAQHEEHVRGSIAPGKQADLVVLERSPFAVPRDEISSIRVLETWIEGERVYGR